MFSAILLFMFDLANIFASCQIITNCFNWNRKKPLIIKKFMWILCHVNCTECLRHFKFNLKLEYFLFHFFYSFRKVKILWTEIFWNSTTDLNYDLRNCWLAKPKVLAIIQMESASFKEYKQTANFSSTPNALIFGERPLGET